MKYAHWFSLPFTTIASKKKNNVFPVIYRIARYFFVGRFISSAHYGSSAKKRC